MMTTPTTTSPNQDAEQAAEQDPPDRTAVLLTAVSTRTSWGLALQQLMAERREDPAIKPKYRPDNPRPPGVIRNGSATQQVLAFLRAHPGRFFPLHHLVAATGRHRHAVGWALVYLRAQGHIKAIPLGIAVQNPRYLQYGVPATAGDEA